MGGVRMTGHEHEFGHGPDESVLREEIARLEGEVDRLRAQRAGSADSDQLMRLRSQVSQLAAQNDRLAGTLRDARDQIVALKAEVDRLAQPPNTFGAFLSSTDEGTVEIISGGRKMRVTVSPEVDAEI